MKNSEISSQSNKEENYINKLKEIFEYYCQYGERLNSRILKSHGFIKLFRESGIMDKKLNTTRLEIIYKSINKNNQLNFDQFLNSLVKISSYKYNITSKKDIKNATQKIILEYLYPLYYSIIDKNNKYSNSATNSSLDVNYNNINQNFEKILYTKLFEEILIQVVPSLFDIYKTYFTNEISISDNFTYIKKTSYKNYFTLIKNLEIIPYLLSNSTCYQIYKYETSNSDVDENIKKNKNFYLEICKKIDFLNMNTTERYNKNIFGKFFIFFKFLRCLIKMAIIIYEKINEENNNNNEDINDKLNYEEMFILFLQKIEKSEGFNNFTKINNMSHNYKTSNIIPINFSIKLNENNNVNNKEVNDIKENNINNENMKIDINQNIETYEPKYINYINEIYGKDLLNLYKTIVNYGDQFNFQYMKSKAFFKFLSDSNLIKTKYNNFGIKVNLIDIFFIKMCILMKNNENFLSQKNDKNTKNITINVSCGEIDYPTFIISIEILSRYLYPNLPVKKAIDKLITEYILNNKEINNNKISEIEQKIENLKELQNNEEMISFLQLVHKAFYPLFLFYTKENDGLMSLNDFMKFTKDFEIFPYLIGKAKLNSMFNNISQYSSFTKNNTTYIEHSLFVDLIALMALDMIYPEPQPTPIEKLLIFIDKISQSAGQSKIVMRTGNYRSNNFSNFIDIFKEQYPEYFNLNDDDGDNTNDDFENIMKSNYDENINDENENKNHDADNNKNENNNDIKDENENEKENNLQKNEININNNNIDS